MGNISKNKNRSLLKKKKAKKDLVLFCLLLFFVVLSMAYISSPSRQVRSAYNSSQLDKVTTKDDVIERTDYIDSEGRITIAADQGYATVIISRTEQGKIEKYYDEKGTPISRYNGYYAVLREYDMKGNNTRNTYMDNEGRTIETSGGYAIEVCEYNNRGQAVSSKYYDRNGNPTLTALYGYGKINEYDERGNNTKTTYVNSDGSPMVTGKGYASIVRQFYSDESPDKGKVESEFYYNENGMPIALSLGQYAIHKEYNENGQASVLIYLNPDGVPIVTKKGYAKIVRTYHADNSIATEQYYDLKGNPVSLSEGQYGIKRVNGHTVYLNSKGEELFNIRNFLYNHSWMVIILTILILIVSCMLGRKQNIVLLAMYLAVIAYLTLLFRDAENYNAIILLEHYRRVFTDSVARSEIIKNIWLFVPLGFILYQLYPQIRILIFPIILSAAIEGIQYLTGTGYCELDDIISNSIGGIAGYCLGKQFNSRHLFIFGNKNSFQGENVQDEKN